MNLPPSLSEGRRLVGALDELETTTVVSAALPPAGRAPRMQAMVNAVHRDYEQALAGPAAGTRAMRGAESFADMSARARDLRGPASRAAPGRGRGAPPPRNVEPDVVERIRRYAGDISDILGDSRPRPAAVQRAVAIPPPRPGAPVVRAGKLSPPEARKIRLAHELGTKPLVAWTIVRMSGDMASAFSRTGEPALVGFHSALAAHSFCYWRGLITNVTQFLSTLFGLALNLFFLRTRPRIPPLDELHARARSVLTTSPRWVYRETWELMGQGGKVFETGNETALRSLLQPDGTIVTHARTAALDDDALTRQHTTGIDAWLGRLLAGWKAANDLLELLVVVILLLAAGGAFTQLGLHDVWHALLSIAITVLAPIVGRGAVAAGIRYLIFRAR